MNLPQLLSAFGLSETEAAVYLKILKLGKTEASVVASRTSIKRPTVYHALETLSEKGMVHAVGHANITRYEAEPPEQLKIIAERKRGELLQLEKKLDKSLPFFPVSLGDRPALPHVEFYQGREGIKNLAEQVVNNRDKKLWALVPSLKDLRLTFSEEYMAHFLEIKKSAGIATKSIWDNLLPKELDAYNQHFFWGREIRLAPKSMRGKYNSIILIWDNKVAIMSGMPELYGFLVTSFDYSETMKTIWQALWGISKPPSA